MASAHTAAAATQPEKATPEKAARDNLIHILRGVAIFSVVTFHLLIQHIHPDGRGLDRAPVNAEWVNWILIWCLPWFVLTGGAVAYWGVKRLWARTTPGRDRRRATLQFLQGRLVRMLVPYFVFVAIMAPMEILIGKIGGADGICRGFGLKQALTWVVPFPHADCLQLPKWPFWFLMFYIPVTLASPLLVWAFEKRWGRRLLLTVPMLVILLDDRLFYFLKHTAVADLYDPAIAKTLITPGAALAGLVNVLAGFILFFAFGFLYASGFWHSRRKLSAGLGVAMMATTLVLMTVGPYTTGGQQFPMMAGYVLWGIGTFQLMVAFREGVERLWRLRFVRPVVDWLSTKSYTIYIWHMALIVAAWWTLQALGANGPLYSLPMIFGHLALFIVAWLYIVPTVDVTFRFESWTFPPRWWARRHHSLPPAERAGSVVKP